MHKNTCSVIIFNQCFADKTSFRTVGYIFHDFQIYVIHVTTQLHLCFTGQLNPFISIEGTFSRSSWHLSVYMCANCLTSLLPYACSEFCLESPLFTYHREARQLCNTYSWELASELGHYFSIPDFCEILDLQSTLGTQPVAQLYNSPK